MPHERDTSVSFAHRVSPAELPEWMDQPCEYETFRACIRDLAKVNRVTLAYGPTLRFLSGIVASQPRGKPLRILDVGSGGGDMLRRIESWARRQNMAVQLTGVDLNPHATRAARELSPPTSSIRWVTGDARTLTQADGVDVVLCSLLLHHLEDAEIEAYLHWVERTAARGWFINDLRRSERSYSLFRRLSRVARWHPFVQHDGPVSIRRSFREADWQRLLSAAGIATDSCSIRNWFPGRLCVGRSR